MPPDDFRLIADPSFVQQPRKPGDMHSTLFCAEVAFNGRRYQVEIGAQRHGRCLCAWQQVVAAAIRGKGKKSTWGGLITLKTAPIILK